MTNCKTSPHIRYLLAAKAQINEGNFTLACGRPGTHPFPKGPPKAGRAPNLPSPDNTRPPPLKTGITRAAKGLLRVRIEN